MNGLNFAGVHSWIIHGEKPIERDDLMRQKRLKLDASAHSFFIINVQIVNNLNLVNLSPGPIFAHVDAVPTADSRSAESPKG